MRGEDYAVVKVMDNGRQCCFVLWGMTIGGTTQPLAAAKRFACGDTHLIAFSNDTHIYVNAR